MTRFEKILQQFNEETGEAERAVLVGDDVSAYQNYLLASEHAEELSTMILEKKDSDAYVEKAKADKEKADSFAKKLALSPEELKKITPRKPVKGFDEFVGLDKIKDYLKEDIVTPWKNHTMNQRKLHGLFIYGPEGVAKTTLVRSLIHELGATGFFFEPFKDFSVYNDANYKVHTEEIFQKAEEKNNVVIYFPAPVAFFPKDNSKISKQIRKYFLKALKKEMKRVEKRNLNILFVAATTAPDKMSIDAFGKYGFDDLIRIHHPDRATRLQMMEERLSDIPFEDDQMLKDIALRTHRYTTKELSRLCRSLRKVDDLYSKDLPKGQRATFTRVMLERLMSDFTPVDDLDFDKYVSSFEDNLPQGMHIVNE